MTTATNTDLAEALRSTLIRIARRIDRQVSIGGLTSTETSVLISIVNHGPIGLGELATRDGINPTMLSRVVGKLEVAGLVRRQASPTDRRAVDVIASRKGLKRREKLLDDRTRLLTERLAELSPESINQLAAATDALAELAAALEPRVGPASFTV